MNPNVLDANVKVVRGGSWKDVAYFCKWVQEIMSTQILLEVTSVLELYKIIWVQTTGKGTRVKTK
jgi:hypothetical protein